MHTKKLILLGGLLAISSISFAQNTPPAPLAGVIKTFSITQPKDHTNNSWQDLKYMKNVKWAASDSAITPDGRIQFTNPQNGKTMNAPIYISGARTMIQYAEITLEQGYIGPSNNLQTLEKLFGKYQFKQLKNKCDNLILGEENAHWQLTPTKSQPIYITLKTSANQSKIRVAHNLYWADDQDYDKCNLKQYDAD